MSTLRHMSGTTWPSRRVRRVKAKIFERDGWRCTACSWTPPPDEMSLQIGTTQVLKPARYLTVDHVIPASQGGMSTHANLTTLCNLCNEAKGDRLP